MNMNIDINLPLEVLFSILENVTDIRIIQGLLHSPLLKEFARYGVKYIFLNRADQARYQLASINFVNHPELKRFSDLVLQLPYLRGYNVSTLYFTDRGFRYLRSPLKTLKMRIHLSEYNNFNVAERNAVTYYPRILEELVPFALQLRKAGSERIEIAFSTYLNYNGYHHRSIFFLDFHGETFTVKNSAVINLADEFSGSGYFDILEKIIDLYLFEFFSKSTEMS